MSTPKKKTPNSNKKTPSKTKIRALTPKELARVVGGMGSWTGYTYGNA